MIKPPIPINEEDRLAELKQYEILDTLPEADYDNITKLASQICGTHYSTVSLVDSDRVYLKSHHNLPANEAPRDTSFCGHAINVPYELMIITDSREDERFRDNPNVSGDLKVIFYAGIPLVTTDNVAIGTLCVFDNKPHHLTDIQIDALKTLGSQVTSLLKLRLSNKLLEEKQKKLKSMATEMETFAYVASHDLKEPLRMVSSFMTLLEKKNISTIDNASKKYIHYAVDGCQRMNVLIDDLLAYYKAGSDEEVSDRCDVVSVIKEILKTYQLAITQEELIIKYDPLPVVNMSRIALTQVFQNLISNAIKYQKKGTTAQVNINVSSTRTEWVFSIKDNGIGIKQEYHQTIFEIFKRLHNKVEYSGTGIGLAIVKKIIEQHGGRIWVESEYMQGSTFLFTIKK